MWISIQLEKVLNKLKTHLKILIEFIMTTIRLKGTGFIRVYSIETGALLTTKDQDTFVKSRKPEELLKKYDLKSEFIVKAVIKVLKR